jgi:hypothetical protein
MTTRSTKTVVEVLYRVQDPPLTPQSLPAVLSRELIANWSQRIQVISEYQTDITQALDTNEERLQLVDRPLRTQSVQLSGMNKDQSAELFNLAMRLGKERQILPLYPDRSRLTATAAAAQKEVQCTTAYRRFHKAQRVMVHDWSASGEIGTVELGVIDEVLSDRLVLVSNLSNTFDTSSRVYPLLDTEIQLNNRWDLFTRETASGVLRASEIVGHHTLPATVPRDSDGFSATHNGLAIFSPKADWTTGARVGVIREGSSSIVGRGRVINTRGTRPRLEFTQSFTFLSREDWWNLHRFLDARRGRAYPFFYAAPHDLFTPTALTSTTLTVEALRNTEDFEDFIQYLAIKLYDGTIHIRGYTSPITDLGSTWEIDFDTPLLGVSLSDVQSVTSAHKVRNKTDQMVESWLNDEVVQMDVTFQELPKDESVSTADVQPDNSTSRSSKIVVEVLAES